MSECASKVCGCTTEPIIQPTAPAPLATGSAQAVYRIENMDCSNEEKLIRSHLGAVGGVQGLDFDLRERTLVELAGLESQVHLEIDGAVFLREVPASLRPGDIVNVLVEDADAHDLFGAIAEN